MAAAAEAPQHELDPGQVTGPTISAQAARWQAAQAQAELAEDRYIVAVRTAKHIYPPMPAGEPALNLWQQQVEAIDISCGVTAAEDQTDKAWRTVETIAREILEIRPATAAEAALKFGILLTAVSDGAGGIDNAKPVLAFLHDLEHLARLHRS